MSNALFQSRERGEKIQKALITWGFISHILKQLLHLIFAAIVKVSCNTALLMASGTSHGDIIQGTGS